MATENEVGDICSLHQCPPEACPTDCPNKNAKSHDSEPSLNKEKHFSKEEILKEIGLIAQGDKIEPGDLEPKPEKEMYDKEGDLIYLSIQTTKEYALKKNEGSIGYKYIVKGTHEAGGSLATIIMKAYGTIEKPDEVYFSNIVLEYNDAEGKWFKP